MKKTLVFLFFIALISTTGLAQLDFGLHSPLKIRFQKPDPFYNGKILLNDITLMKIHADNSIEFKLNHKSSRFDDKVESFVSKLIIQQEAFENSHIQQTEFKTVASQSYKKVPAENLESILPEFLFSRKAFTELTSQNEFTLYQKGSETRGLTYKNVGTEAITILINGKSQLINALVAEKHDMGLNRKEKLFILNNPNCPLLLKKTIEWEARQTIEYELKEIEL